MPIIFESSSRRRDEKPPRPGLTADMSPPPDHGEDSYVGAGRLEGLRTLITGGDSGIGRAVAIAFAREGADVAIAYLDEHEDAEDTKRQIEAAGRRALLMPGDLSEAARCRAVVSETVASFGGLDVLVNNAARQSWVETLDDLSDDEWEVTLATNLSAIFYLAKAAVPHMSHGGSIINTASINSDAPNPHLLAYAASKGAIQNFTGGLAQLLADKGIRVNAVAPGPVWTPLIPSTMPADYVAQFGQQVPMKRPAQPRELAPVYVLLASDAASYMSGSTVAVTGGKPMM